MKKRKKGGGLDFSFDFSALSFGAPDEGGQEPEQEEIPRLNTGPVIFDNALEMVGQMDYTKDYFALVSGRFVFGDFIEALIAKKGLRPSAVYITTLGMNQDNIDSLVNLVDCLGTKKVNLLVSHYFAGTERHNLMPYIYKEFSGRPMDVAVLQSHCKIVLILSRRGDVMISGSANLSGSNNVEQFILMHDPVAIAFVKRKLDSIMERFKVYSGVFGEYTPENNKNNTGNRAFDALKEEPAPCQVGVSGTTQENFSRNQAIARVFDAYQKMTVMLTGDAKNVADQVAAELGIDNVYSELLADKVSKVEELLQQETGKAKLAFVGDGINDAPVLSRADIGIAMGAMGSDAAIEAADIVLMDDDPMKIAKATKISRKCLRIVYQNIVMAIGVKAACLILGAVGIANMYLAIFADVGVMILAVLNAIRCLSVKNL